ncbi:MAG TPA: hypothetical protein VEW95_09430 [Candidatus Limnocylindrales bacterium]|nr:hypothetical protein [Candidatus Limnocylindrales bacterium]
MARLALTVQEPPSAYPTLPLAANDADVTFTAAGAAFADGASFPMTGRELLLVRNPSGGALTVTINSVSDSRKRTGDITAYSIGAGEVAAFWPNRTEGWRQTTGLLHFAASAAELEFAVIRLPA